MHYRFFFSLSISFVLNPLASTLAPVYAQTILSPGFCNQQNTAQDCMKQILTKGRRLVSYGDYSGALTLYQQAAQLNQNDALIHSAIGFLQIQQSNFAAAAIAYQRAIALAPMNDRFHYALGFSLAYLGDNDGAEQAYRTAIKLRPNHVDSYLSLGLILTRKGEYRRALLSYVTALALQPERPQIYQAIGAVYVELGKYQEANTFFERAGQLSYRPTPRLNRTENGLIGYQR
jgi:Flp pilus assembly protein TadD